MKAWKIAAAAIVVMILALSIILFNPSFMGAAEAMENAAEAFRKILPEKGAELTNVKVRVLLSDMGFSEEFLGNETGELKPVQRATIWMGGNVALTDSNGEATLIVPKGNITLYVSKDGRNYWRENVMVDGNETITVKFFLYKLRPATIDVRLDPFKVVTPVAFTFKLPLEGEYYVGKPVIAFYTPWGELRFQVSDVKEVIGISYEGEKVVIIKTAKPIAEMIKAKEVAEISYEIRVKGGLTLNRTEKINGNPAYILPGMTYLPVERVELEESP